MLAFVVVLTLTCSVLLGRAAQKEALTATTGEPVVMDIGEADALPAMTWEEYQIITAAFARPHFVPIAKRPANLSAHARFGHNFLVAGLNRNLSWILDGNDQDGYVLIADVNGNGDLTDDARLPFQHKDGQYTLVFRATGHDAKTQETFRVIYTIHIGEKAMVWDANKPRLCLLRYNTTLHPGVIQMPNRALTFGIVANAGYGRRVIFDLNGDGKLDLGEDSSEGYDVSEKIVRISGTDYEFSLEAHGRALTLTPLAQNRPATAVLRPGYPAPDFSFTDLDGHAHQLSDYRGKVVLVGFWTTHCGPCLDSMPRLLAAYAKYHASGFEIVGIDGGDSAEVLKTFVAEKAIPWMQTTQEKHDGPIHQMFRYEAWPTYYMVGRDGVIVARSMGSDGFLSELPALLRASRER